MTELAPEAPPVAGPVTGHERITAVDTLRGVAVLGILVMNIYAFAMPFQAYSNPLLMGGTEWYNLGTWFVTHVFFDMKFMTIFSILFGGGLVIMWQRAEARGASFGRIYYRRMFWLLVIGAVHAYLIWFGDILVAYATMGMLVFLFRRAGGRRLVIIGACLLPIATLISIGGSEYMSSLEQQFDELSLRLQAGEAMSDADQAAVREWEEFAAMMSPTRDALAEDVAIHLDGYRGILEFRAPFVVEMQTGNMVFFAWRIGGLMLIGMGLMKLGVLSGQRSARFYKALLAIGYGLGLPMTIFSAWLANSVKWDGMFMFGLGMVPNYYGSVPVALGHIAAVMLIVNRGLLTGLMARFSAVGRMALSNYLTHSIVMTTVFYGYGLGLYGSIPRAAQMLFVLGMISLQLWLSPIWLQHFRFGPAEWLWRSLTYWQRQPMLRAL